MTSHGRHNNFRRIVGVVAILVANRIEKLNSRELTSLIITVCWCWLRSQTVQTWQSKSSFSGFNTAELGRPHSAQLSLVVWELALTCDGSPLFSICATLAQILLSLVVAHLPCCFTAGGNTGSNAINFTYHNLRSPIWRYYRSFWSSHFMH